MNLAGKLIVKTIQATRIQNKKETQQKYGSRSAYFT